jgi:hypothetical protein
MTVSRDGHMAKQVNFNEQSSRKSKVARILRSDFPYMFKVKVIIKLDIETINLLVASS